MDHTLDTEILSEKDWQDLKKFVMIIADSMQIYFKECKENPPGKDTHLLALHVLSILSSLSRGYTKEQIDNLWKVALDVSATVHESRKADNPTSNFQFPIAEAEGKN